MIWTQNLSDGKLPLFWKGRARISKNTWPDNRIYLEWYLGKFASGFAAKISFGSGECGRGLMFHLCLPWLVSVYLTLPCVFRSRIKEFYTGISIHDNSFWLYPICYAWESNSSDPWYRKAKAWDFPWCLHWVSTEILTHDTPEKAAVVYRSYKLNRADWIGEQGSKDNASKNYKYTYTLKSGRVQEVTAAVFVSRMTWVAKWWPFVPIKKVRTSIDVRFSSEVGEGEGSWKGGCTGCGYDMLPLETPEQTLRRMEQERKFSR